MMLRLAALVLPVLVLAACSNTEAPAPAPSSAPPPVSSAEAQPAVTTGASADALAPLFGTWALDPAHCEGPVLKISQTRFEGAENGCDITGFTDTGKGSYTAHLACKGEGSAVEESIAMRPIFAPTGEGIDLTYLDRDNVVTTVLRCPQP